MTVALSSCLTIALLSTLAMDHVFPISNVTQAAQPTGNHGPAPTGKALSQDKPQARIQIINGHLPAETTSVHAVRMSNQLRHARVNHLIDQDESKTSRPDKQQHQDQTSTHQKKFVKKQ